MLDYSLISKSIDNVEIKICNEKKLKIEPSTTFNNNNDKTLIQYSFSSS